MIRTRDFFLYVLTVVFLLLAIGATYVAKDDVLGREVTVPAFDDEVQFAEGGELSTPAVMSREERLSALRDKIAAGEGELISAPPVFTSVDQVAAEETVPTEEAVAGDMSTALLCAPGVQYPSKVAPAELVTRSALEGEERVFYTLRVEETVVGSSTEESVVEEPLFALPVRSIRSTFDTCIAAAPVAYSPTGRAIALQDVAFDQGPNSLVGYTIDGFELYGVATPDMELDTCGGHYVNGVYRYQVQTGADAVIGCFAGVPMY